MSVYTGRILSRVRPLAALTLGFRGEHIHFSHRPYAARSPAAQADYDRLIVSIFHHGIKSPLITYKDHVLIGMRRAEIGKRLQIRFVSVLEVLEDVSKWDGTDLTKIDGLKTLAGRWEY